MNCSLGVHLLHIEAPMCLVQQFKPPVPVRVVRSPTKNIVGHWCSEAQGVPYQLVSFAVNTCWQKK